MEDAETRIADIIKEKRGRDNFLSVRIDKTVPEGKSIVKRMCNENCIFDYATGARCNDDLFNNDRGSALTNAEILKAVEKIGYASKKKIRAHIAGDGEPTMLNKELVLLVKMLKESTVIHSVKITSNGTLLTLGNPSLIERLKDAGLNNINISLHSLNKDTFKEITGIDSLPIVLRGVDAAIATGIKTSINCVIGPKTISELDSFIALSEKKGIIIKFFSLLSKDRALQNSYDTLIDKISEALLERADFHGNYSSPYNGTVFSINGALIDLKDSRINNCPNVACAYRDICTEGCRYEARLSRIGILQPCGVRVDNMLDLTGKVDEKIIKSTLISGGKL